MERTNRSRPAHFGSLGSCRSHFWKSRYAVGAMLIAVPGWPLPTFWTASMARTRMVSTAFWSRSVQSSVFCLVLTGAPSAGAMHAGRRVLGVDLSDAASLPSNHARTHGVARVETLLRIAPHRPAEVLVTAVDSRPDTGVTP